MVRMSWCDGATSVGRKTLVSCRFWIYIIPGNAEIACSNYCALRQLSISQERTAAMIDFKSMDEQ